MKQPIDTSNVIKKGTKVYKVDYWEEGPALTEYIFIMAESTTNIQLQDSKTGKYHSAQALHLYETDKNKAIQIAAHSIMELYIQVYGDGAGGEDAERYAKLISEIYALHEH